MARRGLQFIARRKKQILFVTLGIFLFAGLCFESLSQAKNNSKQNDIITTDAAGATDVMQAVISTDVLPTDRCLTPKEAPQISNCRLFFNVDSQEILENLVQNYPKCLDGHAYYYDFSRQPVVKLTKTLNIYGRTSLPFTINGLRLIPDKSFPKGSPAIVIHGRPVNLKNLQLDGFETGILFASKNNTCHRVIGGEINNSGESDKAIVACHAAPIIDGTVISGYREHVSVIGE